MKKFLFGILGLLFALPTVAATLPAGYTELEYVTFNATQSLDTGFTPNQNSEIRIKYSTNTIDSWIYGTGSTNPRITLYSSNAGNQRFGNVYVPSVDTYGSRGAIHTDIQNKSGLNHDGTLLNYNGSVGTFTAERTLTIGTSHNDTGSTHKFDGSVYYLQIYDNNAMVRNYVPVKNGSQIGLYDTVNGGFLTDSNLVAGPVVLDSCRNLFDGGIYARGQWNNDGEWLTAYGAARIVGSLVPITPNTTYTMKINNTSDDVVFWNYAYFDANKNWLGNRTTNNETTFSGTTEKTFNITDANARYFAPVVAVNDDNTNISDTMFANAHLQLELGSTATEYVPYCANQIKIATTAYNSARFSPVVTELNTTIATIRDVVTNTINQTKAIADLQATKQTRPDENCPAGKKCLLVEDNDGQPHWYEIIESAD